MADLKYQFLFVASDPARLHIAKNMIDLSLESWQKLPACHNRNRWLRVGSLERTHPYSLKQVTGRLCPDCVTECEANGVALEDYDRGVTYEEPFEEPEEQSPVPVALAPNELWCPECGCKLSVYIVGPVRPT